MPIKKMPARMRPKRSFEQGPPIKVCENCKQDFPVSWSASPKRTTKRGTRVGCWMYGQRFCSTACANRSRLPLIWLDKHGYPQMTHEGKQRAIHIVVMERKIGRKLLAGETVHHKDGNRANYDEQNLELWTSRHGKGQRVDDRIAAAKALLAEHGKLWDTFGHGDVYNLQTIGG